MHNIDILRNEILTDPLVKGYAGMTNAQILTSLKTKNITRRRSISSAELVAWSGANGRYKKIANAAATVGDLPGLDAATSNSIKNICEAAMILLRRDGTALDFNKNDRSTMVDALVNTGVLSADDRAALYTLADDPLSRTEQLGLTNVNFTDADITLART